MRAGANVAEWLCVSHPRGRLDWEHIRDQLNSCFILRLMKRGSQGGKPEGQGHQTHRPAAASATA